MVKVKGISDRRKKGRTPRRSVGVAAIVVAVAAKAVAVAVEVVPVVAVGGAVKAAASPKQIVPHTENASLTITTSAKRSTSGSADQQDADWVGEFPKAKRSKGNIYMNDENTLAKAIEEIQDPVFKKFLSLCLIQYNSGELFACVALPPRPVGVIIRRESLEYDPDRVSVMV